MFQFMCKQLAVLDPIGGHDWRLIKSLIRSAPHPHPNNFEGSSCINGRYPIKYAILMSASYRILHFYRLDINNQHRMLH